MAMERTSAGARLSRVLQILRSTVYSTPVEFGAALGVSGEIVRRWEAGQCAPTPEQTARLWDWCTSHRYFESSLIVVDVDLISLDEFQGLMVAARQDA